MPPTSEEAEKAQRLLVLVLDAEGEALGGVKVEVIDADLHTESGRTDEEGHATLLHPGSGWIVARPLAAPPLTVEVQPAEDNYVLRVERGVEIRGQVLVDDGPARSAHLGGLISSPRRSALPHRVVRCVPGMTSMTKFEITADADGRFQVEGLRIGDDVWIALPPGTELAEGTSNPTYDKELVGPLVDAVSQVVVRAVTTRVIE